MDAGSAKNKLPDLTNAPWVLALCLLFLLIHHKMTNLGFYGMDDINYARYAAAVTRGDFNWFSSDDHFAHRLIPILFTAFFYWIGGINDFTTALFGILSTIGSCWAVLQLTKKSVKTIQLLSVALFLLTYSTLFASHRLWPDTGIVFFLLTALNSYLNHSTANFRKHATVFAICIFATIPSKETFILFLPLFLFLLLNDLFTNRNKDWWKISIGTGTVLLIAYFGTYWLITGNAMYRYHVLLKNSYENFCSFDLLPFIFTFKRIAYELWLAFLRNGDALILIPAICALLYRKKTTPGLPLQPIPLYFFILLLSSNFMSLSVSSYIPLCQDPRHFLFLIPLAAITTSNFIVEYFKTPSSFRLVPLLYLCAFILLMLLKAGEMKLIYLLLAVFFLMNEVFQKISYAFKHTGFQLVLFAGIFLIRPLFDFIKPTFPQFDEHKKLVNHIQSTVSATDNKIANIYTNDSFTSEMNEYFLKFDQQKIKTIPLSTENQTPPLEKISFLLINKEQQDPGFDSAYQQQVNNVSRMDTLQETNQFILLEISK